MHFFGETLSAARQQGTRVVVVAMPITDLNRALLSDLSWDAYRRSVKAMALAKGASFIDLSKSPEFDRSDFEDTVHLHSGGGKRLLEMLAGSMSEDARICQALNMAQPDAPKSELAEHKTGKGTSL
jgi:hypothetical protein